VRSPEAPEAPEPTKATRELSTLREDLDRAEARVRELRESNRALERRLLRPTGFRTGGLATVAAALIGATVAYVAGGKLGDARAMRESDLAEKRHSLRVAEERTIVDACRLSSEKTKLDVDRCQAERDELLQRARERVRLKPDGAPACPCQPGDPLCSCL
jgi:hypothetical protein